MKTSANNEISKLLGSVRDRDHYTVIRDFFELSAISIRNNFDHGNEYANLEKRYMDIAQGYKKEYLEGFATAVSETVPTMDANGQYSLF